MRIRAPRQTARYARGEWARARVAKGSAPGMVRTLMTALRPKKNPRIAPETGPISTAPTITGIWMVVPAMGPTTT